VDRDTRVLLTVAAVVLAVVVLAVATWQLQEAARPELLQARVVSATSVDGEFSDGARRLQPGETLVLAVAYQIRQAWKGTTWVVPGKTLILGGQAMDAVQAVEWPEKDRHLRVFWFTVEAPVLGGELTSENAARQLSYQPLLAPEMGRHVIAESLGEPHNDDAFSHPEDEQSIDAGTMRYYARVEIVEKPGDVSGLQRATTYDASRLDDPQFPTIHRTAKLPAALHDAAGELFGLPGFEPVGDLQAERDNVTSMGLGLTFTQVVERRLATSSETFAATALTGLPRLDPDDLEQLDEIHRNGDRLLRSGQLLRWGVDVAPRDLLISGMHWIVLVADDGDGVLGFGDTVAHCWRRPPQILFLESALTLKDQRFRHARRATDDTAAQSTNS